MYLLNTKPLPSFGCILNAVFHILRGLVPQDEGTLLLVQLKLVNLSVIRIAMPENVSPTQITEKRHLIVVWD
jgi:hypothetical protein